MRRPRSETDIRNNRTGLPLESTPRGKICAGQFPYFRNDIPRRQIGRDRWGGQWLRMTAARGAGCFVTGITPPRGTAHKSCRLDKGC